MGNNEFVNGQCKRMLLFWKAYRINHLLDFANEFDGLQYLTNISEKYFESILHFKNINSIFAVRKIVNTEDIKG